jgi:glycosyltransferase involved in cell wall biosynthesis
VIGTIATLRPEKNLTRLIGAFAALAKEQNGTGLRLLIVGDGSERAALESAAQVSGQAEKITFAGPTSAPEEMLRRMDIFALSSKTEQMPLSVLEAMASGLPISAVAVGDILDMVAEENRPYIVNESDENAFRGSLRALIRDSELRRRLGRANRAVAVARFDQAVMAERYRELFG